MHSGITSFQSFTQNPRGVIREFRDSLPGPDAALALFFCSSEYDLRAMEEEIPHQFGSIPVLGCTTAGEIGPLGYQDRGFVGVTFSGPGWRASTGYAENLARLDSSQAHLLCQRLRSKLAVAHSRRSPGNSFAFMLIDGLSMREEPASCVLQNALGEVPLVGGSAGDGMAFGSTHVYADGHFRSDRVALAVVETALPVTVFKTQHIVPTQRRLVITGAAPEMRLVTEINGLPAAAEYARLIGAEPGHITATQFAASPLVVLIGGNAYVRSIQAINGDGSIRFFCAIEEGLVLRVAEGEDMVDSLLRTFEAIESEIGPPELVLACDCILRRLEIHQRNLGARIGQILRRNHSIGFNTYGEQFRGVHVNQTLSGVAIGSMEGLHVS